MRQPPTKPDTLFVFPSQLKWMAVVAAGTTVKQVTFCHPSEAAAKAAIEGGLLAGAISGDAGSPLVRRLQAYAAGTADDFRDIRSIWAGRAPSNAACWNSAAASLMVLRWAMVSWRPRRDIRAQPERSATAWRPTEFPS